jgi:hypothetical protein
VEEELPIKLILEWSSSITPLGHKQIFLLAEQNSGFGRELSELGIQEFVNKN